MCGYGLGDGPGHSALVGALQVEVQQARLAGQDEHARLDRQALALRHQRVHHRILRLSFLCRNIKIKR